MRYLAPLALTFLSVALLINCASNGMSNIKVSSDYNKQYDFKSVKRFAFMPETGVTVKNDPTRTEFVNARIRQAVIDNLHEKGIQESTAPEVWIDYDVVMKNKEKTHRVLSLDIADLGQEGQEFKEYSTPYTEGTLIVAVVNSKTAKTVWRGSVQAHVDKVATADERDRRIQVAVKKLLDTFPPQ